MLNREKCGIERSFMMRTHSKQYNIESKGMNTEKDQIITECDEKDEGQRRERVPKGLDTVHLDRVDEPIRLITVSTFSLTTSKVEGRLTSEKLCG
jgi:hypothetical protein